MNNNVMTIPQAAKEIGVHFTTLYRWIEAGKIKKLEYAGISFISNDEIERIIEERKLTGIA